LFDPIVHYKSQGIVVDPVKCYKGENHHPREVYMSLFQACREYIHTKHKKTIDWVSYKTGGRSIWVASENDRLSSRMSTLYKQVYPNMKAVCEKYLKRDGLGLDTYGTHELRRLYVCYSFEFFGRGKTKEIAYAQYVLHHASLSSTIYYTTLQFDMFLGHGDAEQIALREGMIATLSSVNVSIETLKRKLLEVEGLASSQARKLAKETVNFRVNGVDINVNRLTHAGKGTSRNDLVARGIAKGKELIAVGIKLTKNALRKVGVNTLIVDNVYKECLG
jgi:hypothetical protein